MTKLNITKKQVIAGMTVLMVSGAGFTGFLMSNSPKVTTDSTVSVADLSQVTEQQKQVDIAQNDAIKTLDVKKEDKPMQTQTEVKTPVVQATTQATAPVQPTAPVATAPVQAAPAPAPKSEPAPQPTGPTLVEVRSAISAKLPKTGFYYTNKETRSQAGANDYWLARVDGENKIAIIKYDFQNNVLFGQVFTNQGAIDHMATI